MIDHNKHRYVFPLLIVTIVLLIVSSFNSIIAETKIHQISYEDHEQRTSLLSIFPFRIEILNGRRFLWCPPSSHPFENGSPVLFLLHGASQFDVSWFFGLSPWSKAQSQFTEQAHEQGFFIIAPNSGRPIQPGPRAWDAFTPSINESEDLQFILHIIDWINHTQVSVDSSCLFCVGFSSGAFMASRIGHALGTRFQALIVHSGTNADMIEITNRGPVFDCTSPQNISALHPPTLIIHGNKDQLVPVECGIHFHEELLRNGVISKLLLDPDGGHIWLSTFNDDILNWIIDFI
jgi:poly(3-hydroxybutyrate) depolymerase